MTTQKCSCEDKNTNYHLLNCEKSTQKEELVKAIVKVGISGERDLFQDYRNGDLDLENGLIPTLATAICSHLSQQGYVKRSEIVLDEHEIEEIIYSMVKVDAIPKVDNQGNPLSDEITKKRMYFKSDDYLIIPDLAHLICQSIDKIVR